MKITKGSIKRDIFSKSLIIIFLAIFVLSIGIFGLIRANRFIEYIIPMNKLVVRLINISNHFKNFENNLESYFITGAENNKVEMLNELDATINLLKNYSHLDSSELIDHCFNLRSYLNNIFNKKGYTSREVNEITFNIYSSILKINDGIEFQLSQIPESLQVEALKYKEISVLSLIAFTIIALVILISYIFIGFKLSVNISQPIHNLTKATKEVIDGNLNVYADININNEIGILASSFNKMTIRLQSTLKNLQESETKYRTLFEREGDAIILFDTESKKIIDMNYATTIIYGYPKDEMKKMLYTDLIHKSADNIKMDMASSKYIHHKKKDGTTFPADVNTYDITLENKKISFIVSTDITEKLKIEEMLIQSEKMMSIGGLAAGMAHEINNPLSSIISLAGVVLNRLTKSDIKGNIESANKVHIVFNDLEHYIEERGVSILLNNIIDSGKKINEIIKSMLNFSRKDNLKKSYHSIPTLIDETLKLASTNTFFKKVKIKKNVGVNVPDILCDHNKIEQVLFNIINNSIQAMHDSNIENPEFEITLIRDENYNVISIKDNGQGIDDDIKKRIFEPFFTTKAEGKGTGLGLSISYFIITEYHGGKMYVESNKGEGANFIIKLPIN